MKIVIMFDKSKFIKDIRNIQTERASLPLLVECEPNKHSGEGNSRNIVDVSTAGDIVICRNKVVHKNQIQLHKPHFHFLLSAHIQSHSGEGNLGDTIEMQNIVN